MTNKYSKEVKREARVILKIKEFLEEELDIKLAPYIETEIGPEITDEDMYYKYPETYDKVAEVYTSTYNGDFIAYYIHNLLETIKDFRERNNINYKNGDTLVDEEDEDIKNLEHLYRYLKVLEIARPSKADIFDEPKANSAVPKVLYYSNLMCKAFPIISRINNLILEFVDKEGAISEKTLNKLTEIGNTLTDKFEKLKTYGDFANKITKIIDEELMKDGSKSK